MIIATAGDRSSHRRVFYIGAAVGCLAPLVVALVPRRRRLVFWAAGFAEIPALTLMQAYSGGAASGYSVLVIMPMVWFGLEATGLGLVAGMLVLAACGFLPMVLIGPPAYPLSWGHAALLTLVGVTVAGSLRAVVRELGTLARRFARRPRSTISPDCSTVADGDTPPLASWPARPGPGTRSRSSRWTSTTSRSSTTSSGTSRETARCAPPPSGSAPRCAPEREAVSSGVAVWDRKEDLAELLRRSDLALYAAKAAGGGCTEVAPPVLEPLPTPSYIINVRGDGGGGAGRDAAAG